MLIFVLLLHFLQASKTLKLPPVSQEPARVRDPLQGRSKARAPPAELLVCPGEIHFHPRHPATEKVHRGGGSPVGGCSWGGSGRPGTSFRNLTQTVLSKKDRYSLMALGGARMSQLQAQLDPGLRKCHLGAICPTLSSLLAFPLERLSPWGGKDGLPNAMPTSDLLPPLKRKLMEDHR